jgi:hypothetical protein
MTSIGTKRQRSEEFSVAGTLFFTSFQRLFHVLILKKQVLAVSLMAITRQMMTAPQIITSDQCSLPIGQAGGRYCSNRRKFEIMTVI